MRSGCYFAYRLAGSAWQRLPQTFDASILSDEAQMPGSPNFTGAFVGMACQDMAGTAAPCRLRLVHLSSSANSWPILSQLRNAKSGSLLTKTHDFLGLIALP